MSFTGSRAIVRGVRARLNNLEDAACVVASCVRAERIVPIRMLNGSSAYSSEIFSTAGSSRPVMARASDRMISRFDFCWIPDAPGDDSNAGKLSEVAEGNWQTSRQYVGALSRFETGDHTAKKYDIAAILSGPEPQRTALEEIIVPQLKASNLKFIVVRGVPNETNEDADDRVVNFLGSDALQSCIEAADLVIARSGYSTVMDMAALGKKAIFIPTPGQTEQEYLAKRAMARGIAFCMKQSDFNLARGLQQSARFRGFSRSPKNHLLEKTISAFLH